MSDPTDTSAGAILGELFALRKLYVEAVAHIKRTRATVRDAEFFDRRKAVETFDGVAATMQAAYEKHLIGDDAAALKEFGKDPSP